MSQLSHDTLVSQLIFYYLSLMKFLNKSNIVLPFPLKNLVLSNYALHKSSYRQFSDNANRKWIDLKEVCKTGKIPETFNFARDVFEKHVVSRTIS